MFQRALALHRQGDIARAQAIYQEILRTEPHHVESLHLLGVCCAQAGRLDDALGLISEALRLRTDFVEAHFNLGNVLRELNRYEESVKSYEDAIRLKSDYLDAYMNRGNVLHDLKRYDESVQSCDEAIRLNPEYAEAYLNRGVALQDLKRHEEALKSCDEAIRLKPDYAEAYSNRGNVLRDLRRYEESVTSYEEAIRLKPDYAEAYLNRGVALQDLKRHEEALKSCDEAIRLKPDYAEAYSNRGNVLRDLKRYEESLMSCDEAIQLKPDYAEAYSNRGIALYELKRYEVSVKSSDDAIRMNPEYAEAYSNRGAALHELKRYDESVSSFEEAIRLKPDYADAHWNKGLLQLLFGDFAEGWAEYEWRFNVESSSIQKRSYAQPSWRGRESLDGRKILIYAEQGLGDTIQFCRYGSVLTGLGAKVFLEVPDSLVSLMRSLQGSIEVVSSAERLPEFDYHCPLLSLPGACRTTLETIPSERQYLYADAKKVKHWDERLGNGRKPRIGLAWSGNPAQANDHNRSISLKELLEYLPDHAEYFSLQKEIREGDREVMRAQGKVLHMADDLHDFSDTAALMECMDLVISVDTSVAHLGGALGKPTWVLLSCMPDWRWLLDRDDSPWYPSVKLYRQTGKRDWRGVLERVKADITGMMFRKERV